MPARVDHEAEAADPLLQAIREARRAGTRADKAAGEQRRRVRTLVCDAHRSGRSVAAIARAMGVWESHVRAILTSRSGG